MNMEVDTLLYVSLSDLAQVSVTVQRPMSFSTMWSIMLSILFLTDLELKTAKLRKVERGLTNEYIKHLV